MLYLRKKNFSKRLRSTKVQFELKVELDRFVRKKSSIYDNLKFFFKDKVKADENFSCEIVWKVLRTQKGNKTFLMLTNAFEFLNFFLLENLKLFKTQVEFSSALSKEERQNNKTFTYIWKVLFFLLAICFHCYQ